MSLSLGTGVGPTHDFSLLRDWRAQSWDRAATEPSSALASQQDQVVPSFDYASPMSAGQARPYGIQIASTARPYPGIRPPIPPELVPGTPEWADHFIRGLQGLINAFRRSGAGGGGGGRRRGNNNSNDDDDDDECLKRQGEEWVGARSASTNMRIRTSWQLASSGQRIAGGYASGTRADRIPTSRRSGAREMRRSGAILAGEDDKNG